MEYFDIVQPVDGFVIAAAMRATDRRVSDRKRVPIVACMTETEIECVKCRERFDECGIDGFVKKPYELNPMLIVIRRVIEKNEGTHITILLKYWMRLILFVLKTCF